MGLKQYAVTLWDKVIFWQNRTKVGLKQLIEQVGIDERLRQNRTKVGLKLVLSRLSRRRGGLGAKSNQGGIETTMSCRVRSPSAWAKSNQGGIETFTMLTSNSGAGGQNRTKVGLKPGDVVEAIERLYSGKIEPRWD